MKTRIIFILMLCLTVLSCKSQESEKTVAKHVGGPCEGCEAIFEYGDRLLSTIDTLFAFQSTTPRLKLSGTVFQIDGKTPAKDVIIYIYHTDRKGLYTQKKEEQGWGKRHGSFRGWVKTDASGQYTFYTFRPVAYPSGTEPEHIHITVKEPDKNAYYIDAVVFDDDPLLSEKERKQLENRAGSGIVFPTVEGTYFSIKRDIILGLNIPDY